MENIDVIAAQLEFRAYNRRRLRALIVAEISIAAAWAFVVWKLLA